MINKLNYCNCFLVSTNQSISLLNNRLVTDLVNTSVRVLCLPRRRMLVIGRCKVRRLIWRISEQSLGSCLFFLLPVSPFIRSLCQGVPHMWWETFEKEEDEHKEKHVESHLQWGHYLRHPTRQHGPRQPAHLRHGLRLVRNIHAYVAHL